jgi:hypothetical protein
MPVGETLNLAKTILNLFKPPEKDKKPEEVSE